MVSYPECLGRKRCPLGPNNEKRIFCPAFEPCLDSFILSRLRKHRSISTIGRELTEVWLRASAYFCLRRIGRVALANGYDFGRKAVDSAIEQSTIKDDCEPGVEAREIRIAFGVYGRGSAPAKSMPLGPTGGQNIDGDARFDPGPMLTPERQRNDRLRGVGSIPLALRR